MPAKTNFHRFLNVKRQIPAIPLEISDKNTSFAKYLSRMLRKIFVENRKIHRHVVFVA